MSDGKLREYYWRIWTHLTERSEYLDTENPAFQLPEYDEVENTGNLNATLVFRDGSHLYVQTSLDDRAEIREYEYAYVYSDSHGRRVFQYDDAPHHPRISTHPHHLHRGEAKGKKERVYALDIAHVDFVTVVEKIIHQLG